MLKTLSKFLRGKKGITGVDITIAIGIIAILTPVVLLVFTNIYLNSQSTKRNSEATSYATQILEAAEKLYYDDLTHAKLLEIRDSFNIPKGYEIEDNDITVTQYETDPTKPDLVKTIEVTIHFKVGKQMDMVKLSKIKTKENLVTPNRPEISDGMIPVKYVTTDDKTGEGYWQVTSKDDPTWYSYENKRWANMMTMDGIVLEGNTQITNENKEELAGKRIINLGSMFVWIPRYSYKITYYTTAAKTTVKGYSEAKGFTKHPNHNLVTQTEAFSLYGDIDVKFLFSTTNEYIEDGRAVNAEENGYIIHPAFKDGKQNNFANGEWDKEIKGLWVAKFAPGYAGGGKNDINNNITPIDTEETYSDTYSSISNYYGSITKNVTTMKYPVFMGQAFAYNFITSGDSFKLSKALTKAGNPYGFNSNQVDSHMMKNSEWGAVGYLTHSKYGLDGKNALYLNNVYLNNLINTIYAVTGYATQEFDSLAYEITTLPTSLGDSIGSGSYTSYAWYTINGQKGSSTQNITGVYDMSGCTSERTASYILNTSGQTSRTNYGGALISETNLKYKTIYQNNASDTSENNWSKYSSLRTATYGYGDSILETSAAGNGSAGWNADYSVFAATSNSFFAVGGNCTRSTDCGAFCYDGSGGSAMNVNSFRPILISY